MKKIVVLCTMCLVSVNSPSIFGGLLKKPKDDSILQLDQNNPDSVIKFAKKENKEICQNFLNGPPDSSTRSESVFAGPEGPFLLLQKKENEKGEILVFRTQQDCKNYQTRGYASDLDSTMKSFKYTDGIVVDNDNQYRHYLYNLEEYENYILGIRNGYQFNIYLNNKVFKLFYSYATQGYARDSIKSELVKVKYTKAKSIEGDYYKISIEEVLPPQPIILTQ